MHSVATRELVHLLHKRLRSCHPFLRPEARKRAVVSTVTQCHFFSFRSNCTGVQRKDNIGCDHFSHLRRVCCVCRTEYDDAHGRTRRADFLVGKTAEWQLSWRDERGHSQHVQGSLRSTTLSFPLYTQTEWSIYGRRATSTLEQSPA